MAGDEGGQPSAPIGGQAPCRFTAVCASRRKRARKSSRSRSSSRSARTSLIATLRPISGSYARCTSAHGAASDHAFDPVSPDPFGQRLRAQSDSIRIALARLRRIRLNAWASSATSSRPFGSISGASMLPRLTSVAVAEIRRIGRMMT